MLKIYLIWEGLNSNKVQLLKSFASEPSLSHPRPPNFPPFHTTSINHMASLECAKNGVFCFKYFKEIREVR